MITTTKIGLMPFPYADEAPTVKLSRREIVLENPIYRKIGTHKILLNINHDKDSPYEKDLIKYKNQLLSLPLSTIQPPLIAIENEPDHYPEKSIEDYCNELVEAVKTLPGYNITNGGFTLPLYYWYYEQTKDAEFFDKCIPDSSKQPLINGNLADKIKRVQYQLTVLAGLIIKFWNLHVYLRNAGEVAPMVRMINFVSNYIGHGIQCLSNEAGIYDPLLLNDVIYIAKLTNMKFIILYSGEGVPGQIPPIALPISKAQFQEVTQ